MTGPRTSPYEILDDRFRPCANGDQQLETLYTECRWAEGPIYVPAGRYLLWSDIPNDRMLRWDETTGHVGVFRSPAGNSNGNTLDRQGRLITCEQGNRRVTRTEHDGSITVLAEHYGGNRDDSEIGACNVYRLGPDDNEVKLAADGFAGPNGLVLAADGSRLYVSDSRANNIRFDDAGLLWAAACDDGVHCYAPDGSLIGKIRVPEIVANIAFGGPKRHRMFLAANTTLYCLVMSVTGLTGHWR